MGVAQVKSNPTGAVNWPFELGEDLSAGEPVYIYDDGGAKVKKVYSALANIASNFRGYYHNSCLYDTNKIAVLYRDLASSNHMYVICGEIQANNSVTWGTKRLIYAAYAYYLHVSKVSATKIVCVGRGTGSAGMAWVCAISGTTVTSVGSGSSFTVGYGYDQTSCYLADDYFAVAFRDSGMMNHGYTRIGSCVGGTTITWGTAAEHGITSCYENWLCKPDPASSKLAVFYRRSDGTTKGFVRCATYSGLAVGALCAEVQFASYPYYVQAESIGTDKVAVESRDMTDGNRGKVIVGTFSGTTPSFVLSGIVTYEKNTMYYPSLCKLATDKFVIAWLKWATPYQGKMAKFNVSGVTITKEADQAYYSGRAYYSSLCYVADEKYFLCWYAYDESETQYIVVDGEINLLGYTSGLMQESGLLGESKNIDLLGGISEQLSGMTPGDHQYIQDDASISSNMTDYHIGLALEATKMLIMKTE